MSRIGSFGPSLTYGGGYGTRTGTLNGHSAQLQGSYGLLPCLEVGPYLLGGVANASTAASAPTSAASAPASR
jgi:hypothetical protein